MIDPRRAPENRYEPDVRLTDFLLRNESIPITEDGILRRPVDLDSQLVLPYEDNSFGFEFAALNCRQPEKNRYSYLLEGIDREWVTAGADIRRATFTHIPPGQHVFRVRASNGDGLELSIREADQALYRGKHAGHNQVVPFTGSDSTR